MEKPDFLANFWRWIKEFQFKYPLMHKAFAVCDADTDPPAELLDLLTQRAANRLGHLPFSLTFHVIKRELETWWVADSTAISGVTGVQIPFPGGNVEEDLVDPKGYIIERLKLVRRAYTRTDAEAAARVVDLEIVSQRGPGFVKFSSAVRNGSLPHS